MSSQITTIAAPPTPEAPFLTEVGAAKRLALAPGTLRNWRSEGRGPAYLRLGAAVRYDVVDLDAWARNQRVA